MRSFLKRHMLWASLIAVMVPLSVMLYLQYQWLVDLEEKSRIAHKAALSNYLEAITSEVEYFYRSLGERALNLPSSIFIQNKLDKAAWQFQKKDAYGAKRLFVVSFVKHDRGKLLFYDPLTLSMETPASLAEARAAYVASAPWQALNKEETRIKSVELSVDERDVENRIILNPILDEESRVVGVAGMILDPDFFGERLLPKMQQGAMPHFFSEEIQDQLVVRVRDRGDRLVMGPEDCEEEDEVTKAFTFAFVDHRIGIASLFMTPEKYAHMTFVLNMSISIFVMLVLLGVIVMALRTASREMRLSQMKGDFVSNVSHELRTPLASIRVFGEFFRLGRVRTPEKSREYGEYIETESRRLTGLVNNILDFSKIESGGKTYRLEDADINEVLDETLKTFEVRLRHSGFRIKRDGIPKVPMTRIDPSAISQAVSNLLDNAVKYSGNSKEISVGLAQENGEVVISVRDRGIGISKEEQKKIFDRFHRVSTGLVHDVKGSGLGLSIVNHIVEAHEGWVTVDSDPGQGSTFSIHLPIKEEDSHA